VALLRGPPVPGFVTIPNGPLLPAGAADARAPLFEAILSLGTGALKMPGDAGSFLHFERLVHIAELLGSTLPLPPNAHTANDFRFLLAPILATTPSAAVWNIDGVFYTVAAHEACYQILNWFKESCDALDATTHPQAIGLRKLALRRRWG